MKHGIFGATADRIAREQLNLGEPYFITGVWSAVSVIDRSEVCRYLNEEIDDCWGYTLDDALDAVDQATTNVRLPSRMWLVQLTFQGKGEGVTGFIHFTEAEYTQISAELKAAQETFHGS